MDWYFHNDKRNDVCAIGIDCSSWNCLSRQSLIMKEKTPQGVVITGILALTAYGMWAIFNGIDGKLFTFIVSVIALAIGVTLPQYKLK